MIARRIVSVEPMSSICLSLLGGFEATLGSGIALHLPTRKAQALLAYLALRPGQAHPRDKLAALLWGDVPDSQARASLRQTLSLLGKALDDAPTPCLVIEGRAVAVASGAIDVDVARFEATVAEGTAEALERAAQLYRGDLLDGLVLDEAAFEAWLLTERERLREIAIDALAKLLAHHQAPRGSAERAIQAAVRLLALDPCQEPVHRALMRLYARQGRHAAALRQYQVCVTSLRRELNAEPEAATKRVYREILERRAPAEPASSSPEASSASSAPSSSPARASLEAPVRETPVIGRASELRRLSQILEEAWGGTARVAVVVGEAGIGKTRLVEELGVLVVQRSGRAVVGRCYETEQILPFAPWVEAFRAAGVVGDASLVDELPLAVRVTLGRLFPELTPRGVDVAQDPDNLLRLFEALSQLAAALAARAPLLVVIEDLHWADDMTLRFLAFLGRRFAGARRLVVGTVREEEIARAPALRRTLDELRSHPAFTSLPLGALSNADTLDLVRALAKVGTDATAVAGLAEEVWRSSEGNPFVAVETMRAIEDGVLATAPGAVVVPGSVRELILRRLERLSAPGRQLAAVAAVAGGPLDFALIQRASGLSRTVAADGLEELVRHRVVHGVGEGFDFTHDRVRQVADAGLLAPRRETLHAALAEALETLHEGALGPVYDRLAYHWTRADEPAKAVTYLTRFAERAAHGYAHADAADALGEALTQAGRLPPAERDLAQVDVVLRQVRSLSYLGRLDEALAQLQFARPMIERLGEPRIAARYYFLLGNTESLRGEGEQATAHAFCALEEARRVGDEPTLGRAHFLLSLEGFWSGRLVEGVEHGGEAVRRLARAGRGSWLGLAHWVLGFNHTLLGEFEAALAAEDRARAIGEALDDARLQSAAAWTTGGIHALVGDATNAIAACQRGLELSPDPLNTAIARGWLGYAYLVAGEADRAVATMSEAVAHYARFRFRAHGWFTGWLAEAHLARGEVATAEKVANDALVLATAARQAYGVGIAERALGLALTRVGAPPTRLEQARATFARIGARFEVARTDLELAALAARTGHPDAARDHAASAQAGFVALGAARYVGRADELISAS